MNLLTEIGHFLIPGFDALQMRGDVLELVGLFFVPDNFIVMMQEFCSPVAVECLIVTRQDHQAAVTVFLPKIADALGRNIDILFRAVDFAFHVFVREKVGIEYHLTDVTQEANPLCPVAAQPHAANQWPIVDVELQHLVHLFEQVLHIMLRMARAVADQPDIRIDKLQLQHLLMITRAV